MFDDPVTRPSVISRTDPRVRVLCAIAVSLCLAPLHSLYASALGLLLSALLLALARPYMGEVWKRLGATNTFVLFLAVALPLSVPGDAIGHFIGLTVSRQGVSMALLVAIKANAFALSFIALMASMSPPTAAYAMESLHFPSRLVFIFIFSLRFIHVIAQEWTTLTQAARLRGFRPSTSRRGYSTLACLLGILLVRANERATRVHEAMLLRGFSGHFRSAARFRTGSRDAVLAACVALGIAGVLFLEFDPAGSAGALLDVAERTLSACTGFRMGPGL